MYVHVSYIFYILNYIENNLMTVVILQTDKPHVENYLNGEVYYINLAQGSNNNNKINCIIYC